MLPAPHSDSPPAVAVDNIVDNSAPDESPTVWRFDFRGQAGEFFRIWLVNLLLTVVTLGFYSPWAKVRTRRYFYGSAFLNNANFEYDPSPWSILLARLVVLVVLLLGLYWAGEHLLESAVHATLVALLLPWAVVRGFAFNARYSVHRGARFRFKKNYAGAYAIAAPFIIIFILPGYADWLDDADPFSGAADFASSLIGTISGIVLAGILLLFFFAPWLVSEWHAFKARNHSLGPVQFHFEKPRLLFYFSVLWGIPAFGMAATMAVVLPLFQFVTKENAFVIGFVVALVGYAVMFLTFIFTRAALFRLFWNGLRFSLGDEEAGRLRADFTLRAFAVNIMLVNYLAVIFSLGMLYPWAQVRRARFLADHMTLETTPAALDKIPGLRRGDESALGEEFEAAEGFDFDVGLV